MPKNPVNVILMIVLAAFVIDRLVAALLFLLSFSPSWVKRFPDPLSVDGPAAKRAAYKSQKLIYVILATILAFAFLETYKSVGVLSALKFQTEEASTGEPATDPTKATSPPGATDATPPDTENKPKRTTGDFLLTLLILVGGAENIAKLLKGYGAPETARTASQPIEITGKLTLEDRERKT